jgi:hypothetical protein
MAKARKGSKRRISLAAFLRKLWSSRQMMERFSESREGRREVIARFNLTARHARLMLEGCVRDIVVELAGGKLAENSMVSIGVDRGNADVTCGHPECKDFMKAVVKGRPKAKKKR